MATDSVTVSPTFNGDSVSLTAGMIVRLKPGANNNVVRAQADSAPHVQGVNGVVVSGSAAPTGVVTVVCTGRETVQMESGLTPAVGDTVYVSPNVAGKGTNVLPAEVSAIGTIADVSAYATSNTVEVDVSATATAPTSAFAGYGTSVLGPTAVGTPGVSGLARRTDQTAAAYRSDLPLSTTWFIDPVAGSDAPTNPGTTSATALATLQELKRRWWGAEFKSSTTVTILGNLPPSDAGSWHFTCGPNVFIAFIGSLGPTTGFGGRVIDNSLYSGTVTGFLAASATMAADDVELTDAAVPVSYSASGLLAPGVIFKRTNSTARYWYALKDLGNKTIRINPPMNLAGVQFNSALTIGDTYSAFQLWTIYDQDFGAAARSVIFDSVDFEGTFGAEDLGYGYTRRRNWIGGTGFQSIVVGTQLVCCMFAMPSGSELLTASPQLPAQINGGAARGTGDTVISIFGRLGIGLGFALQGCRLVPNDGSYLSIEGTMGVYDTVAPAINPVATSRIIIDTALAGAGISGKGNSSKLLSAQSGSTFSYSSNAATPPFIATSSSDPLPIQVGVVSYAVAAIPAVTDTLLQAASVAGPGGPLAIVKTFSGVILTSGAAPTFGYLADTGTESITPTANQTDPIAYPTSARLITRLRGCQRTGTGAQPPTFTLYKNGVATTQTVTLPASTGGQVTAVDLAHPILFADGDTFDVRCDFATTAEGNQAVSATLEGPC